MSSGLLQLGKHASVVFLLNTVGHPASPSVVLSCSPNAPFLAVLKVWLKDEKLGCDMVKGEGKARSGRPLAVDHPLSQTDFLVPWQMMAVVASTYNFLS